MPRIMVDKQWQAQDDLRTLQNADEIRKSKARLNAAQAEAKKQMDALKKVSPRTAAKRAPRKPRARR